MSDPNSNMDYRALHPPHQFASSNSNPQNSGPQFQNSFGILPQRSVGANRGPPPSYEEANNPNAPPPSYDSLFGRVREVHKSSSGIFDFLKKLIFIIAGTIGCTIVIAVTIIIPVAMIAVGAIYFDECPAEDNIPIYLIVGGCVAVFKQLLSLRNRVQHDEVEDPEMENHTEKTLNSLISFFLFCWFLTGCYWVYQIYEPDYYNLNSPYYCDETPYLFAFWLSNGVFIVLAILSLCLCCAAATAMCLGRQER